MLARHGILLSKTLSSGGSTDGRKKKVENFPVGGKTAQVPNRDMSKTIIGTVSHKSSRNPDWRVGNHFDYGRGYGKGNVEEELRSLLRSKTNRERRLTSLLDRHYSMDLLERIHEVLD